jgi:hypothetical protein
MKTKRVREKEPLNGTRSTKMWDVEQFERDEELQSRRRSKGVRDEESKSGMRSKGYGKGRNMTDRHQGEKLTLLYSKKIRKTINGIVTNQTSFADNSVLV